MAPRTSVLIPVRDGGEEFRRCLSALGRQRLDGDFEIVVVDSGSTDDTVEIARAAGARVESIPRSEFNYGGTRNLLAELASGEILVAISHDAYPERDDWLESMTRPFGESDRLAGVYGRQVAHADAPPPQRFALSFLYGDEPRTQTASRPEEISVRTTLFTNVCSAIRRRVWEEFPFASGMAMGEDQEWARRVLLAGYAIRYEPRAVVRHSHPYTLRSAFRRYFDLGTAGDRAFLAAGNRSRSVLRAEVARYARAELAWLVRERQARWIPYALTYEATKFAALQLGARHERIPLALKRRMSQMPDHW